jgi:hypothetical protein
MTDLLRVRATGAGLCPLEPLPGQPAVVGRFAGMDKTRTPLPKGELVPDTKYYRDAIHHGALALVPDPAVDATANGGV